MVSHRVSLFRSLCNYGILLCLWVYLMVYVKLYLMCVVCMRCILYLGYDMSVIYMGANIYII